jgi:hypothetical protein
MRPSTAGLGLFFYFFIKVSVLWHQGVCFDLPAVCFFVLNLHKKYQGIAKSTRAVLTYARGHTQKRFFWAPQWGFGGIIPYTNTKT